MRLIVATGAPETWAGALIYLVAGAGFAAVVNFLWQHHVTRRTRRGRARLMHEDLMRCEVALLRVLAEPLSARWREEWFLAPMASATDAADVVSRLNPRALAPVSSALGWAEYSRNISQNPGSRSDMRRGKETLQMRIATIDFGRYVLSRASTPWSLRLIDYFCPFRPLTVPHDLRRPVDLESQSAKELQKLWRWSNRTFGTPQLLMQSMFHRASIDEVLAETRRTALNRGDQTG